MGTSEWFFFPSSATGATGREEWPFYLDRRRRALLRSLYKVWGDDAVVQIYGGYVRIRADSGDWRFSDSDLDSAIDRSRRMG